MSKPQELKENNVSNAYSNTKSMESSRNNKRKADNSSCSITENNASKWKILTKEDDNEGMQTIYYNKWAGETIVCCNNNNNKKLKIEEPIVINNSDDTLSLSSRTDSDGHDIFDLRIEERNPVINIENIKTRDKVIKFYTAFNNYDNFLQVFKSFGNDVDDLYYYSEKKPENISTLEQFLITIMLLKNHKSHYEISILFDVTLLDIKNIFITWIRFMRLSWKKIKISKILVEYRKVNNNHNGNKYFNKNCVKLLCDSKDYNNMVKVFKILEGPQNYIELYLIVDIVFVCQVLYKIITEEQILA